MVKASHPPDQLQWGGAVSCGQCKRPTGYRSASRSAVFWAAKCVFRQSARSQALTQVYGAGIRTAGIAKVKKWHPNAHEGGPGSFKWVYYPDCDQRFIIPWARKYSRLQDGKSLNGLYKSPKSKMDLANQIGKPPILNPKEGAHDWIVVHNVLICKKCLTQFCSFELLYKPGADRQKRSPTEAMAVPPCQFPWFDDTQAKNKLVYLALVAMKCSFDLLQRLLVVAEGGTLVRQPDDGPQIKYADASYACKTCGKGVPTYSVWREHERGCAKAKPSSFGVKKLK